MSTLAEEANWPRETLDRDYSARASVTPETFEQAMRDYRSRSQAMAAHCTHRDVVYDAASGATLDIYGTGESPRPAFVFIHGGYWRMLAKEDSAFMAGMLAAEGIATVAIDYRLAPAVTLAEIVREVRAAIAFLWKEGRTLGINPERMYVGGSSAGGHLTGAVLSGGWHGDFGVPEDVVKGAMPISGLFHLAPISRSFVNDWMKLSDADVAALSPAETIPAKGCPIVVAYADGEPDGFRRQSTEYDRLWRDAGHQSKLIEVPGRNHFDVILDLEMPDTILSKELVGLIKG